MSRTSKSKKVSKHSAAPEAERQGEEIHEQEGVRSPISEYLAKIGQKGGLKGGKARAAKLSPEKRREIAKKAAAARWDKSKSA